jgi:hypothetical protein
MSKDLKPIDKMTAHFRNKIAGGMESLHIPEWEMDVWFKPTNTLEEESKLVELAQKGKTIEALVETFIMKARNEDGTKMFSKIQKPVFMNEVDPAVFVRVVGEMNAFDGNVEIEEVEKN